EEAARLLGGGEPRGKKGWAARPVEIVDAGHKKPFELRVEVPVEDLSRIGELDQADQRRSIWPAIHPRLLELIGAHRSTMIFVNSRRLAERLAGALNELAGSEIALAHHGSVAREKRAEIEDRLKRGELPCIVATSSLELGIDMGSVDLVIQIEAPPSIASGLQRIGRAGHQVGGVRRAAPFAELPRASFEGVLDMLSGRYPSDEFAELKARLAWDRVAGTVRAREGAARVAVVNGGTIPDRGLYGVFIAGQSEGKSS